MATREGHTPIVRLLVEHGAQLNIRVRFQFTLASEQDSTALLPSLQSTSTLNTALHEAAAINDSASVQYLLSVGADPSLVNSMGELPFDQTNLIELKKWAAFSLAYSSRHHLSPSSVLPCLSTGFWQ